MTDRSGTGVLARALDGLDSLDPALVLVLAVALMAGGTLVVVFPILVAWIIGLGLVLGGVAILGTLLDRSGGRQG